jgi:hypothetical protein
MMSYGDRRLHQCALPEDQVEQITMTSSTGHFAMFCLERLRPSSAAEDLLCADEQVPDQTGAWLRFHVGAVLSTVGAALSTDAGDTLAFVPDAGASGVPADDAKPGLLWCATAARSGRLR